VTSLTRSGRNRVVFSAETLAELSDVLMRAWLQCFFERAAIEPQALLDRLSRHRGGACSQRSQ